MSYILDALKKADSERQHGRTPDIYTQQTHHHELERDSSMWKNPMLWFFIAVLMILLGGILYLNIWQRPPSVAPSPPTPIIAAPVAAPNMQVAQASAPVAPPTTSAVAPPQPPATVAPSAVPPTTTAPEAQSTQPTATLAPEPVKLQPSTKLSTHVKKEKKPIPKSKNETNAEKKSDSKQTAESATETVTKRLIDLPTNVQSEIPPISVGGYIYSDNKSECQLLINKLLLHEGEQVSPGLILEKMMPHSAILNYKGNRFRISY